MIINFAHANGIPAASYAPLFQALQPHQVIYNPKYGHNPAFPPNDNWTHLADEMLLYVSANASEPVVAVGHSMGAIVSYLAAAKRPELFRGVLMLDPPLMWGPMAWALRIANFIGKGDAMTPAGKSKHRRRSWPDRDVARQYFASKKLFQFEPRCFDAFFDAVVTEAADGSVELFFDVDVEVAIFRNTPLNLKSVPPPAGLPIKVVYADQSNASLPQAIKPFCAHFDISLQRVEGEHMYPLQKPGMTVELIRDFVEAL